MKRVFLIASFLILLFGITCTASAGELVGVCTVLSSNILGDKDNEAPNMVIEAANGKFSGPRYVVDQRITATDFKNYLGKKDMLVSEVPKMIDELKLPVFVGYGAEKNLGYLMVIFCEAKPEKFEKKSSTGSWGWGGGGYSSSNQILVKKVELLARVVVVDVKKQEYVYNVLLKKNVDDVYGFSTEVRAIRSVVKEFVKDFDSQIKI